MTDLMIDGSTTVIQRPDAPYDLTDEESDEWRAIVASMPADHFARTHYPMLTQLCRHTVASRRVAQLVQQCIKQKKFNRIEYASLLAMHAAESAAIIRLCRSMRLTQQSSWSPFLLSDIGSRELSRCFPRVADGFDHPAPARQISIT
jgi:hypothetical protein